jgi:stage III sporulation protein AB
MTSAIGVACLLIGCGGIGFAAFLRLERRVKLLSEFSSLAGRLVCEIGFRMTPLTELPGRIPNLQLFWDDMAYDPYGEETYSEAWGRASENLDLPPLDRALLRDMGEVLGRYDADNQAKALEMLQRQLGISLEDARKKRADSGKLYALAGLLCGLIIAVLLI